MLHFYSVFIDVNAPWYYESIISVQAPVNVKFTRSCNYFSLEPSGWSLEEHATCHWKCPLSWRAVIYNASETVLQWQFHSALSLAPFMLREKDGEEKKKALLINIPSDPKINIYFLIFCTQWKMGKFWHCPLIASNFHFHLGLFFASQPVIYASNSCIINFEFTTV